ncbi:MAG TPA: SpoIIE family protein phosphatase [Chthoniobacter sp.]|nr:SpoIIE family protein phosphatase [Chthoniobacter sp.]
MSPNHDPVSNESPAVRSDEQLRLELVLAATRMGAWDFQIETRKMSWDRQMHALFGLSPDSFGGRDVDFCELVYPEDRERVSREFAASLQGHSEFDTEFRVVWPSDGSVHILRLRAQATTNGTVHALGIAWDVTERRRTEADLERKRSLLDALMAHLPDKIYFKDSESRFIWVNKSKLFQHGLQRESEMIGKTDYDFFPENRARDAMADEQKTISTGLPVIDKEEKNVWPDGTETWVSTTKMPLRDSVGHIIGTFGLSRDITRRKRTEDELGLIANELRARNAMLEEDLKMARELQNSMLPQRFPSFTNGNGSGGGLVRFHHYFTPSMAVSGDFFNVCKISESEAGIFICDVMGHGVRAAMVAAMMHSLLGDSHGQLGDPAALLTHLNRNLCDTLKDSFTPIYATAFYVVVDLHKGELRYANAGHPCPLLVSGEASNRPEPAKLNGLKPGPVLGLFENAQYSQCQHRLAPRDVLLLFTDGLFEVEGPTGELYDYQQLQRAIGQRSALPTAELCSGLIHEIQQFSARKEFEDDVCLVAMEIENVPMGSC